MNLTVTYGVDSRQDSTEHRKNIDANVKALSGKNPDSVDCRVVNYADRYALADLWKPWAGMGDYHMVVLPNLANIVIDKHFVAKACDAMELCDVKSGLFSFYSGSTAEGAADLGLMLLNAAANNTPYVYYNKPAWSLALCMSRRNAGSFYRWYLHGPRPLNRDPQTYLGLISVWATYIQVIPTVYTVPSLLQVDR